MEEKYEKPEMVVIGIEVEQTILSASSGAQFYNDESEDGYSGRWD